MSTRQINNYGFIIKGSGYQPEKHRVVLESPLFKTTVVGVGKPEEALDVAKHMKEEGIQVIELCGGFEPKWAEKIMTSIGDTIPIGFITFSEKALELLNQL